MIAMHVQKYFKRFRQCITALIIRNSNGEARHAGGSNVHPTENGQFVWHHWRKERATPFWTYAVQCPSTDALATVKATMALFYPDMIGGGLSSEDSRYAPFPPAHESSTSPDPSIVAPFGLLVFPEAFLDPRALQILITSLMGMEFGCIHLGLRPEAGKSSHLFSATDAHNLLGILRSIDRLAPDDLIFFERWLEGQKGPVRLNLGILFMTDTGGNLRVCLHPKNVPSKYEERLNINDDTMTACQFVTLISLVPSALDALPIHIQPMICADMTTGASNDPTPLDRIRRIKPVSPVGEEINHRPERVDIVSVVTKTPTARNPRVTWKPQFRETIVDTAKGKHSLLYERSVFVLSNDPSGGLSGIFTPVGFHAKPIDFIKGNDPVLVSIYARPPETVRECLDVPEEEGWLYVDGCEEGLRKGMPVLGVLYMLGKDEITLTTVFGLALDVHRTQWGNRIRHHTPRVFSARAHGENGTTVWEQVGTK